MSRLFLPVCLILAAATALPAQSTRSRLYDDPYLSIRIPPGWTIQPPQKNDKDPSDCCVLTVTHGLYVLSIHPIFSHAGPVEGGRINEIVGDQPAVQTMLGNDDPDPDDAIQCAQLPLPETRVNPKIILDHLYTASPRTDYGKQICPPVSPQPVWFGSFFGGVGPESDFRINLSYNAPNLAALPRKGSPELAHVLDQTVRMLRTLRLKPPIVVARIAPSAAPPGTTVTVYGSGFLLPHQRTTVFLCEMSRDYPLVARIAPDGKSLTFVVPSSTITMDNCLLGSSGGCSIPLRSAIYHLAILEEPSFLLTDPVPFTITPAPTAHVTLSLLYPATQVRPGDWVTLHGAGFTAEKNTVHIGSVEVRNLSSPDGRSLRFSVPMAGYDPYRPTPVDVSNAGGASNALEMALR